MPAFCTHYLFLKETQDIVKKHGDFEFNFDAAAIGTQGADIFFFHRVLPISMFGVPKNKIGSLLHRAKPEKIFDAFCEYIPLSLNPDIAKSYIAGFIMHYALDRNCHPYVYYLQDKICQSKKAIHKSSVHNQIETAADTYLLTEHGGVFDVSQFNSADTITNKIEVIDEISHLLAFVVPKVTGKFIDEKDVATAIADTRRMQKILQDKRGALRPVCVAIETIFAPIIKFFKFSSMIKPRDLEKAKKYVNINRLKWKSPFDSKIRSESFEDLFEFSKFDFDVLYRGFIQMTHGKLTAYTVTHNISFLTGTEVE